MQVKGIRLRQYPGVDRQAPSFAESKRLIEARPDETACGARIGRNAGLTLARRTLRRENPIGAVDLKQGQQGAKGSKPSRGWQETLWTEGGGSGTARGNRTFCERMCHKGAKPMEGVEVERLRLAVIRETPGGRRNLTRGLTAQRVKLFASGGRQGNTA